MLTIYLLVLAIVVWLSYQAKTGTTDLFNPPAATETASVGRAMFQWVVFFLTLLVFFIVPALTAGTIAGERERQTLVPLQVTLLRPRSIVLGKLAAAIAFLVLLLVASMPLLTVAYVIGGVTIAQVVAAVGAVLGIGLVLATLSLACSAFFSRVQTATVAAYAVVVLLVGGSFVAYVGGGIIDKARGNKPAHPPRVVLVVNPLMATADVVADRRLGPLSVDSPFNGLRQIGNKNGEKRLWPAAFATLGVISLVALVVASRRLRTPANTER
jgi:ABC-type transport system involved in multi-copper enzyme maturation permease subunit